MDRKIVIGNWKNLGVQDEAMTAESHDCKI